MKQVTYTLSEHRRIARGTYLMQLSGDTTAFIRPGQFLNLTLPGFYLRRPFSVCDWQEGRATVIYKVLGAGTQAMTSLKEGTVFDALTGLGNGFDTGMSGSKPLLIGGGVGVPPLYRLARDLLSQGRQVQVALGFNAGEDVFLAEEFQRLGAEVLLATLDGSAGVKGLVLDACRMDACTYFYACGPTGMLKAVCRAACTSGQLSLEERMGCGFGACMGCTLITTQGPRRVCKEGPVFFREVLGW